METLHYIQSLKHKQCSLLEEYKRLILKALGDEALSRPPFIQAYQEREKGILHRLEHLDKVIRAFPGVSLPEQDEILARHFQQVQDLMEELKVLVRQNKKRLSLRTRQYLLKGNQQKRLYRELKPTYIDIHT